MHKLFSILILLSSHISIFAQIDSLILITNGFNKSIYHLNTKGEFNVLQHNNVNSIIYRTHYNGIAFKNSIKSNKTNNIFKKANELPICETCDTLKNGMIITRELHQTHSVADQIQLFSKGELIRSERIYTNSEKKERPKLFKLINLKNEPNKKRWNQVNHQVLNIKPEQIDSILLYNFSRRENTMYFNYSKKSIAKENFNAISKTINNSNKIDPYKNNKFYNLESKDEFQAIFIFYNFKKLYSEIDDKYIRLNEFYWIPRSKEFDDSIK